MKIERLLAITNYLITNKRATAQMLSDRFHVSVRTVMRDIDTLSLAGIPVITYYGANGGYEILESFKMDRQLVSGNDHFYILTALQALQSAFDDKDLNNTLEKMKAMVPDYKSDMVLDFGILSENMEINEKLKILQRGINQHQKVKFLYTNTENQEKEHEVEPVATMYKWYHWYLLCYHAKYEDYRIYKLIRMRDIVITGQKNSKEHNAHEAKRKWEQTENNQGNMVIKLLCRSNIRVKCEEYLKGRVVEELEDGDFIYEVNVPQGEHFWYGTLLSFGKQAKVLEPVELIERIRVNCNEILQHYKEV